MKKGIVIYSLVILFFIGYINPAAADSEKWTVSNDMRLVYYDARYNKRYGPATINGIEYEFSSTGYVKSNGTIVKVITSSYGVDVTNYYFLDEDDYVVTGWETIFGKTYYFQTSGSNIGKAAKSQSTGNFTKIEDSYYYFNVDCVMQTGLVERNSTYYGFGADGKQIFGWGTINGQRYYFDLSSGSITRGSKTIDGWNYYFDSMGVMQTGIVMNSSGYLCGYDEDGKQLIGWQTIDGKTYYFNDSGNHFAVKGIATIDGEKYYFNEDGVLQKKVLFFKNNKTYYADSEGKLADGWVKVNGYTYYFDFSTHCSVTGQKIIDDHHYLFDEEGHMLTGPQMVNKELYYFGSDGKRIKGWKTINGNKYYFDDAAVKGIKEIDNDYYYFDSTGIMLTGLVETNIISTTDLEKITYAFGSDGKRLTGWQTIERKTYYCKPEVIKGRREIIDGKSYLFNDDGSLHIHKIEVTHGYESTSVFSGLTNGKKCSVCGEVISAQKETPPTYKWENGYFTYYIADGYYLDLPNSIYSCDGLYRHDDPTIAISFNIRDLISLSDVSLAYYVMGGGYYSTYENHNGIEMLAVEGYPTNETKTVGYFFNSDEHTLVITFAYIRDNEIAEKIIEAIMKNIWYSVRTISDGWSTDENGYRNYYMNGVKITGIQTIDGDIYLFNQDGKLQRGWQKTDLGNLFWGPELYLDGLYEIDDEQYYISENGYAKVGWYIIDDETVYFSPERLHSDAYVIEDSVYCFNDDGSLCRNDIFVSKESQYYYTDADGKAFTGWKTINGKTYYFSPSMLCSNAYFLDDSLYCFNNDGTLFTNGWYTSISGTMFYTDHSGRSSLGWKPDENKWYHIEGTGNNNEIEYKTLVLPENVGTIEDSAFEGINTEVVIIPSNCRRINSYAFMNCPNLRYIVSFSNNISVDSNAYNSSNCEFVFAPCD